MMLDEMYRAAIDSPQQFKHKRILWIGSESYDAPAVCVLEGLDSLGFEICTIGKPNVNSWFCNRVIKSPSRLKFDFILSSLHWGTRWSHYDRHKLHGYPKVLIDGDDTREGQKTWQDKHSFWVSEYGYEEDDAIKDAERQTHRWMEPVGDYEPDVLFTMQRQPGDTVSHYLPSGIHRRYMTMAEANTRRHIDFAHFPTNGVWRDAMRDLLRVGTLLGTVHNSVARGTPVYPDGVEPEAEDVHSINGLACWSDYYHILNHSKVLIHPGIDYHPFWDCQRIYEGWACGCVVAMSVPCTDISGYSPTDVCPEAVYSSHDEFIRIAAIWGREPDYLENLRNKSLVRSHQFFTPEPVARYFLWQIERLL
jgi:hypothetical protein